METKLACPELHFFIRRFAYRVGRVANLAVYPVMDWMDLTEIIVLRLLSLFHVRITSLAILASTTCFCLHFCSLIYLLIFLPALQALQHNRQLFSFLLCPGECCVKPARVPPPSGNTLHAGSHLDILFFHVFSSSLLPSQG